jgi:hypothetical protein
MVLGIAAITRMGRQQSSVIARVSDYPLKKDIQPYFETFMAQVNDSQLGTHDPFFSQLVEATYFPSLTDHESENGYRKLASARLTDTKKSGISTSRIASIICASLSFDLLAHTKFSKALRSRVWSVYTVAHVKHFISGIYSWARQNGHYDGANPIQGLKLPKAKPPQDTHAYSLDEVYRIISCLSGRAQLACYIAAYTGLDKGEIEGGCAGRTSEMEICT